jgi:hypothetical protein
MNSLFRAPARSLVLLALLAACGGGGSGDDGGGPPPSVGPCAAGQSHAVARSSAQPTVGRNQGVGLAGCAGALARVQWTQTAGPPVALLADKTQTIAFDADIAGAYAFRATFTDAQGTARSETVTVDVATPATPALVSVRASHSVRMGANVSVRAWPAAGVTVQSITWQVVEGPAATLDTSDSHVAIFTAPQVAADTPMRLRATLTASDGRSDSAEVLVMVERHQQAAANDSGALWERTHISRVYPYRAASPYANVLMTCVYDSARRDNDTCPLAQLPFLASANAGAPPTVEQVMDRVLVSHDWLGRNFEAFLRTQDTRGDFRRMLMSVTAVVLGTHVRPSYYFAGTGAIYLDADNLWLSPAERDTVSEAPDFRSDFDRDLAYTGLWRYVRDNRSVFLPFDSRARITRDVAYLLDETGWLMYHELAHALDFLPPSAYASLNPALGPWPNMSPRFQAGLIASQLMTANYPLTSAQMRGLGQVKFQGATATAEQRAFTPEQVGAFFAADLASDEYNYSTPQEDAAMTLEEFLMSRRLGIQRDIGITDKLATGARSSTAIVRWGQRGRIGAPALAQRAQLVAGMLVPWFDASNEAALLPAPVAMRAGQTWADNLVPGAAAATARAFAQQADAQRLFSRAERAAEGAATDRPSRGRHASHAAPRRVPA